MTLGKLSGLFRCKAIREVTQEVLPDRMANHAPLDVVSAVIRRDSLYLLAQRKPEDRYGGCWEFPGGKVEPGEDLKNALMRELLEEVGVTARVGGLIRTTLNRYPDLDLSLHFFWCEIVTGEPWAADAADVYWASAEEIRALSMSEADREFFQYIDGTG